MLRKKNIILIFILMLITGNYFSCNEYLGLTVDCSECYTIEPDSADIIIYLTINDIYPSIPITVYKDQVEDKRIEHIDTAMMSPYKHYVPVNQYYSVKAEYKSGDRIIYAVDGDKIKTRFVSESCEYDCWVISGGIINVKLKDN